MTPRYFVLFPHSPHIKVGILEHWNLSMDLFNARIKSPVRDWQVLDVRTWLLDRLESCAWVFFASDQRCTSFSTKTPSHIQRAFRIAEPTKTVLLSANAGAGLAL